MRSLAASLCCAVAVAWTVPASADELPAGFESLMREATKQERETIANVAKRLYPAQRQAVDDLLEQIKDDEKAAVSHESFTEGWHGQGSAGASLSTGNSDEWDLNLGLDLTRKGPRWEHRFEFDVNLSDVEGERTEEKLSGQYRARRDFSHSPWFVFGQGAYEHDRFQGIDHRLTEGVGVGYQLIDTDDIDWEASIGPAWRQTHFSDGTDENRLAAFLNTEFDWDITDTLTFSQRLGAVAGGGNSTMTSKSSLTADLFGRLSARLTFSVNRESDPPAGAEKVDTETRVTVVYSM